ncbi:MAG: serine hydrolase [Rhodanobacteraceae bacterium]
MRILIALIALLPFAATAGGLTDLLPERVETNLQSRIKANEYPAVVMAVVDCKRSHIYAFGTLADGQQPDAGTVFEIGSVTKTFTATLLAQAVQAGELKLETPVAELLPDVTFHAHQNKPISLGSLATQHSGLPRLPGNLAPANTADPYADYGADQLRHFLAGYTPAHEPGSHYEYSNLGVGLLGYALARRSGMTYPQLLEQRIFRPLGMRMTGVDMSDAMKQHLAVGHDHGGQPVGNWHFQALAGAGAILSTGHDMLRYLQANMGTLNTPLHAAMSMAQEPREKVSADERIGLIWMTRHFSSADVVWHNGMTGGYASFIGFTADHRKGVVILTNVQKSVDDLGFAALVPEASLAPARKRMQLPAAALDQYAGSYRLAPGFDLRVFRKQDQLYAQASGQDAFPIFASAADEFFANVAGISISFKRNDAGKVNELILHQNGDRPAPRISEQAASAEPSQKEVKLQPAVLAEYVGRYTLAPGVAFTVTLHGDQLMVQLTGQQAFPVFASSRDHFFYRVVDAQLRFQRDKSGKVDALILHQAGRDQTASRVESQSSGG